MSPLLLTKCNKNKMKIKEKTLEKISGNNQLKARLSSELNKSSFTIHKWITENHDNLTKASALKIIREELGLNDAQILEEVKVA